MLLDPTDTRDIEQSVPGRGQRWIIENSTGDEGGELAMYKLRWDSVDVGGIVKIIAKYRTGLDKSKCDGFAAIQGE